DAGCSDYLCKPINRSALIEAIEKALPASRDATPPSQATQPAMTGPGEDNASLTSPDVEVLQFLPLFLKDLPAQVEQLSHSLSNDDPASLGAVLHQLRGSCGLYGYGNVGEQAEKVERLMAQEQEDRLTRVAAEVEALITMIQDIAG